MVDFSDLPRTMDSEQVADLLGHPVHQIRLWAREGTIPAVKDGRFWVYDRDELLGWVRNHRVVPED